MDHWLLIHFEAVCAYFDLARLHNRIAQIYDSATELRTAYVNQLHIQFKINKKRSLYILKKNNLGS